MNEEVIPLTSDKAVWVTELNTSTILSGKMFFADGSSDIPANIITVTLIMFQQLD